MAARAFYGWRLLAAFWLIAVINLAFPAYGSAVLNAAMAAELGFDRQSLGMMVAIYLAMSGLPGPLVAMSVNRLGVRWTLVIGSAFVIVGAVMLATIVTNVWLAVVAFGLLVGIGVATGAIIASQAGVARWFVRRRALALSILYSGGAIGGFIAPPILSAITTTGPGHWRYGWWLVAGLSVIAALIAIAAVREQPSDVGQAPDGLVAGDRQQPSPGGSPARVPAFVTRTDWTYRDALRGPYFWTMITPFLGVSAGFALFLGHGIVHLKDLGHSIQVGAWAIGTMTISGLIAKAILAALGDRLDPRYLWAIFCAAFGVGLLILVGARAQQAVTASAICMGVGFGGGIVAMMATLSNYYGTKAFASLSGLAIAINTGVSSLVPVIAGRMYDLGFGYSPEFYVIAAWCILGGAMLAMMKRPQRAATAAVSAIPGDSA